MSKIEEGNERIFLTLDIPKGELANVLDFEGSVQRFMRARLDVQNDDFGPAQVMLMPIHELLERTHSELRSRAGDAERSALRFEHEAYEAAEHRKDYLGAIQAGTEARIAIASAQAYSSAAASIEVLARHLGYSGDFPEGEAAPGL